MHVHGRPWGMNGPEFLVVYAVVLIVVCCVVAAVRFRLRDHELGQYEHGTLNLYERAYLNDGAARVADTALAGLVEARAVRVNRGRRITATGPTGRDGFQNLVLDHIKGETKVAALRREVKDSGRCAPIEQGLRERKLLVSASGRRVLRAVLGLYPLLLAVGVARAVDGSAQGYPIGLLIGELFLTLFVWVATAGNCGHPLATKAGESVKYRDRVGPNSILPHSGTHRRDREPTIAETGRLGVQVAPEDAASRVAKGGLASYPDTQIARLLEPPNSGGGGGASGVGGAGGGGGGGGCGGGGC